MPRTARAKSKSGIYHVMLRGIDRSQLFYDDDDRAAFIDRLRRFKLACGFSLYAYCLMGNHVHLLLREGRAGLADAVKRIALSYSAWFNAKYERSGYLFQGRYKSAPVSDNNYLLAVVRYIHSNPAAAGQADSPWTSYGEYMGTPGLVDVDFVLNVLSTQRAAARRKFKALVESTPDPGTKLLRHETQQRMTDDEAIKLICQAGRVDAPDKVASLPKAGRDGLLLLLKQQGITVRQLSRLTGINRGIVQRAQNVSDYTSP